MRVHTQTHTQYTVNDVLCSEVRKAVGVLLRNISNYRAHVVTWPDAEDVAVKGVPLDRLGINNRRTWLRLSGAVIFITSIRGYDFCAAIDSIFTTTCNVPGWHGIRMEPAPVPAAIPRQGNRRQRSGSGDERTWTNRATSTWDHMLQQLPSAEQPGAEDSDDEKESPQLNFQGTTVPDLTGMDAAMTTTLTIRAGIGPQHARILTCVHACTYVYTYTHTRIYTYIYTHPLFVYTQSRRCSPAS
jgi:hypothetical protein